MYNSIIKYMTTTTLGKDPEMVAIALAIEAKMKSPFYIQYNENSLSIEESTKKPGCYQDNCNGEVISSFWKQLKKYHICNEHIEKKSTISSIVESYIK